MTKVAIARTIPIDQQVTEVVERKGIGHPDTIADGIAEAMSVAYAQHCLREYGVVLHHHFDKTTVMGGKASHIDFGKGEMEKPIRILVNGRVSTAFANRGIDYREIQERAAKMYLQKILPHLDVERFVDMIHHSTSYSRTPSWYRPKTLDDLPEYRAPYLNDSSAIVSFWPLSLTERLVLAFEGFFYDQANRPKFQYIGQDIKILAVRQGRNINLTMCIPFISTLTPSRKFYIEGLHFFHSELEKLAHEILGDAMNISVMLNTNDYSQPGNTRRTGSYLSSIGSALDYGEEGTVGRGNRARGLICCLRPSSTDAIHGKNPAFHVGKVYAYFSDCLSRAVAEEMECECTVILTTQNRRPTASPQWVLLQLSADRDPRDIKRIIERELHKTDWVQRIVHGGYFMPRPGKPYGQ